MFCGAYVEGELRLTVESCMKSIMQEGGTDLKEEQSRNFWKIHEFSKKIGKHYNTVDSWFKRLEEKGVHYINRVHNGENSRGEKVYDEQDLKIALHIKTLREQQWNLDPIIDDLHNHFETRDFPEGKSISESPSLEEIKKLLKDEIEKAAREMALTQIQEFKNLLPKPISKEEERQKAITDFITQSRVKDKLEIEALELWSKLDVKERFIKVGLFKKVEDETKKRIFIREHVNKNLEKKMKEEYGLE